MKRLLPRLALLLLGLVATVLAVGSVLSLTGQAAMVTTDGVSMNPVYYDGDLVVIARASSYSVGDIAAYHLVDGSVVLHRIVGGDATGFTFRGDNNESVDVAEPAASQILGVAVLHIPQAGVWLERITSAPMLALYTFALVASGTATATRRRRSRKRERMSRHATTHGNVYRSFAGLSPALRASAIGSAVLFVAGGFLAVAAWGGPLDRTVSESTDTANMGFFYTADVGRSAAYDDTVAEAPEPIFRALTDTVEVLLDYRGEPGTISVAAELSTPEGWRSTVVLAEPVTFEQDHYKGSVVLNLKAIEARADEAAEVIGLPVSQLSVSVTAHVQTDVWPDFQPKLDFTLTPAQLTLVGGTDALSVDPAAISGSQQSIARTLGPQAWEFTAEEARVVSVVLLLIAVMIGAITALLVGRAAPADESAAIRRRYAELLVRVHPMTAPAGRPVVEVTTFSTLAKIAERYGLLVLHWVRSDVETFVVQDESTTYRYRIGDNTITGREYSAAEMDANLL